MPALEIEWIRVGTGEVKHALLPDWLHSVGSRGGPHRWSICGRAKYPNPWPTMKWRPTFLGGPYMDSPDKMRHCKICTRQLEKLLQGSDSK